MQGEFRSQRLQFQRTPACHCSVRVNDRHREYLIGASPDWRVNMDTTDQVENVVCTPQRPPSAESTEQVSEVEGRANVRALTQARSYARLVEHDEKMNSFLAQRPPTKTSAVPRVGEWAVRAAAATQRPMEAGDRDPAQRPEPEARRFPAAAIMEGSAAASRFHRHEQWG